MTKIFSNNFILSVLKSDIYFLLLYGIFPINTEIFLVICISKDVITHLSLLYNLATVKSKDIFVQEGSSVFNKYWN